MRYCLETVAELGDAYPQRNQQRPHRNRDQGSETAGNCLVRLPMWMLGLSRKLLPMIRRRMVSISELKPNLIFYIVYLYRGLVGTSLVGLLGEYMG